MEGDKEGKNDEKETRELRRRAELLVKMKRELQQAHRLCPDEEGKPLCWWPIVEEWEKAKREAIVKKERWSILLKVKKEEPLSPKIHIKVEDPPTPTLLYPSHPSQYTSIDPNLFNCGETAMVEYGFQEDEHTHIGWSQLGTYSTHLQAAA